MEREKQNHVFCTAKADAAAPAVAPVEGAAKPSNAPTGLTNEKEDVPAIAYLNARVRVVD